MTLSRRLRLARWAARHVQKPLLARARDPRTTRLRAETAARLALRGRAPLAFRSVSLGGVPARHVPGGRGALFHIHGGAFVLFSARSHQGLAQALARPLGLSPVLPDYPRAPEHPFPAALDAVTAAWAALPADGARVLSGDSAGGGLALALLARILARGLPCPAAVLLFSPWADLTCSGESVTRFAAADPLLPADRMRDVAEMYLAGHDPRDPEASPLFADLPGAPPMLIQCGDDEILRSDAERLAARQPAATLQVIPGAIHAFQLLHGWIPEADAALDRAVAFAAAAMADEPTRPV